MTKCSRDSTIGQDETSPAAGDTDDQRFRSNGVTGRPEVDSPAPTGPLLYKPDPHPRRLKPRDKVSEVKSILERQSYTVSEVREDWFTTNLPYTKEDVEKAIAQWETEGCPTRPPMRDYAAEHKKRTGKDLVLTPVDEILAKSRTNIDPLDTIIIPIRTEE